MRAGSRRILLSELAHYLNILGESFPMAYMEIELLQSLVFKLRELKKKKLEELGGQYCVEKNVIPEAETF